MGAKVIGPRMKIIGGPHDGETIVPPARVFFTSKTEKKAWADVSHRRRPEDADGFEYRVAVIHPNITDAVIPASWSVSAAIKYLLESHRTPYRLLEPVHSSDFEIIT